MQKFFTLQRPYARKSILKSMRSIKENALRRVIRTVLEKYSRAKKIHDAEEEKLLTEPDETDGREESEVSSGGVAGVSVPLGASSTYPKKSVKKKRRK